MRAAEPLAEGRWITCSAVCQRTSAQRRKSAERCAWRCCQLDDAVLTNALTSTWCYYRRRLLWIYKELYRINGCATSKRICSCNNIGGSSCWIYGLCRTTRTAWLPGIQV